jgi:hypothetical protein
MLVKINAICVSGLMRIASGFTPALEKPTLKTALAH